MMSYEADQKAIEELTSMASAYVDRGQLEKAAELLRLAEKITRRLYKSNIIELNYWQQQQQQQVRNRGIS
ncbi:MAG TPA: hypothetical protein V6C89_10065 [Drouetiella sp.]